jgi:hypothetical protein
VQAGPNDVLSFKLDNDAAVMKCSMDERFTHLKIGDDVTISYFEEGNSGYIASEVDSWPMGLSRC